MVHVGSSRLVVLLSFLGYSNKYTLEVDYVPTTTMPLVAETRDCQTVPPIRFFYYAITGIQYSVVSQEQCRVWRIITVDELASAEI